MAVRALVRGWLIPALCLGAVGPALAQEPPSAEELIERIESLREEMREDAPPSAQELIERVRSLREDAPGAAGQEPEIDEAAAAELRERLAEELGVEVLDLRPFDADGRPAYAVKVMNPAGNFNDAFTVSTLVVDRESGEVLGAMQPSIGTAADFSQGGAQFQPGSESSGLVIRRRTYR